MPDAARKALSDVGVIVLAAGEGRRLGLGPKAHVRLGPDTFLERIVRTCRDAGLSRTWAIGSPGDSKLSAACAALSIHAVINPQPEHGMSSSVHLGLRAAKAHCARGIFVFPVDHPLVRPNTLVRLAAALETDAVARPLHAGRHGHPILLGAALVSKLLRLSPETPLRDALAAVGARGVEVPCDDPATLDSVNIQADLSRCEDSLAKL